MQTQGNPFRSEIEDLIRAGDLNGLLRKAGELHGHLCNYLTFGVKAGYYGVKEMGLPTPGWRNYWPSWRQTTALMTASKW